MPTPENVLVDALHELIRTSPPRERERGAALLERLREGDLRVALVGEAKRGKSTLGNALLGAEVLPAGVVPVTALTTEVHSGAPAHADVTFTDGSTRSVPLTDVEQFVSERRNPGNKRGVRMVGIQLPQGLPHPRMVLIDTPGVGSVHQHNTDQAREAFNRMDAAVCVLTTDPPISASELALLDEVADRSVRVFIVLNKADQLTTAELDEASTFVREVVTARFTTPPTLWVCSAREGLRARAACDDAGWTASGVPALSEALVAYVTANRVRDLRRSVTAATSRLALKRLDVVRVTLAAARATRTDHDDRVKEFTARLDAVDRRARQALEFIAADLTRQRSAMDADAARESAQMAATVGQRLEGFLAAPPALAASDLEEAGRALVGEQIRSRLEQWRTRRHEDLMESVDDLVKREQAFLDEASGVVSSAAQDAFGVRLRTEVARLTTPDPLPLTYAFEPDISWNHDLVSWWRTHAPSGVARRRVAGYLRTETARLVDKHVGRARADLQSRVEEIGRRLRREVSDAFTELTEGLRVGQQIALELRRHTAPDRRAELAHLESTSRTLERMIERLDGADEPAVDTSQAPRPAT